MIPEIKLRNGNMIPKLGLGTWEIGGRFDRDPNNDDQGQIEGIRYSINSGIRLIRTAQNYASGYCEELISKATKGLKREKLFYIVAVNERFAPTKELILKNAIDSMKRLNLNYIDLYMMGGLSPDVPLKEISEGLLALSDKKIVKNIGVGNYRLEELKAMDKLTKGKLVYNELHYNLIIREPETTGTFDYCLKNNIVLSAYRPLQLGQLSKPGIKLLDDLAKKYNKTQAQIALKWLIEKENVIVIPKAIKQKHIKENIGIFDFEIEKKDLNSLNKDFPIQIQISDCSIPKKFIL